MVNGRCKARPLRAILVMAGLDPAIHPFRKCVLRRGWIRGPSPRRSGFGRAGGSSPRMTQLRFPDAAQRAALLRRAGIVPDTAVRYGPGSAAHQAAKGAARCTASGERKQSLQLQPDHAHQAVRHLFVAFELRGMRDQQLAVIKIDERLVVEHDPGQLLVDRLALRRVCD